MKAVRNRIAKLWMGLPIVLGCSTGQDESRDEAARRAEVELLEGWVLSGPAQQSYALRLDRETVHTGKSSGRLEHLGGDGEGAGIVVQDIPADAFRNKRVRFSAFVRTRAVERWAGLVMKVERPDGREPFDNMQDRPLGGTRDWSEQAIVLDVPSDARSIRIGWIQDGPGTTWVDDAALTVVGNDVPVTELDRRPPAPVDTGFEEDLDSGVWLLTGIGVSDYRVERSTDAHSGEASLLLQNAVDRPRSFATVEQPFAADRWRGKRVRFSAWVKGEDVEGIAGITVTAFGPKAPPLSPGLASSTYTNKGSFAWERQSVVLDVPPEADSLVIGLGTSSKGRVFLDDVAVEEVGLDVPVTNVDVRPTSLVNASLDVARSDDDPSPEGWFVSGGARLHYRAVLDSRTKREGQASARFEPAVDEPQGYGTLMQRFRADAYRGKRMRLTAYTKGQGVDGRADLWMRVQARESPADGAGLGGGACQLSGDYDWSPCVIVFDVPRRGDAIDVGLGTTGHGTLWLDGLTLEEVGLDIPLTHERRPLRAVENGTFEASASEPKGWFLSGGGKGDFAATVEEGAARLRAKDGVSPSGYGTLMQSIAAGDYLGKRVRLVARVRGQGVDAGDLWIRIQSPTSPGDGPGLGGGSCPLSGDFAWQPCEIVLDVPESAAWVQIGAGLRGAGSGTLWLDDVRLEEVERAVPASGRVRHESGPTNLGFEP